MKLSRDKSYREGFIFPLIAIVISWLSRHMLYNAIRFFIKRKSPQKAFSRVLPDAYVLSFLVLSTLLSILCGNRLINSCWLTILVCIIAVYRLYEIVITLINNFFFIQQDPRTSNILKNISSMRRSALFLLINVVEMVNLYVIIGCNYSLLFLKIKTGFVALYRATTYCLLTFNQDPLLAISPRLENIAFAETITGLFIVVLVLSRIINEMPALRVLEHERNEETKTT